ncbi:hypothetical protein HAX54_016611 [Datura stramonium]|uniref:Uncharacterized protein n=1 Tax=Datura stramonium TaxID=4076 RepID=A0ABS8ULF1_DATST|nr:hypothetical protein [Datura stramonium]
MMLQLSPEVLQSDWVPSVSPTERLPQMRIAEDERADLLKEEARSVKHLLPIPVISLSNGLSSVVFIASQFDAFAEERFSNLRLHWIHHREDPISLEVEGYRI